MELKEKIIYCRKKAGLSQEALAEKIDVSRQAVSKWETGDAVPELGKLKILASIFGVTTDWLLSEEDPPSLAYTAQDKEARSSTNYKQTFSRYFNRYGWALGLIPIIIGAMICLGGAFFLIISNAMVNSFDKNVSSMQDSFQSSFPGMYPQMGSDFFPDVSASQIATGPNIIAVIILIFGGILIIGGIITAIILKKRSKK